MSELSLFGGCIFLMNVALFILLYPLRKPKIHAWILGVVFVFFTLWGYWHWGGWPDWLFYKQKQVQQEQAQRLLKSLGSPQDVIDKLKVKLKEHPDSARGWYLLGRLYVSESLWEKANEAYGHAYRLQPENVQTAVNYAYSLWQLNHMTFNDEIRSIYKTILQQHANQPDSLGMLAMDAFGRHSYQEAIDHWQQLLKVLPPQSDEARAVHKAIIKAQKKIKTKGEA